MSSTWGRNLRLSIFGESHGACVGIVIDGLPAGMKIDEEGIAFEMARRAPGNDPTATARKEPDRPIIESGVYRGYTTGAPVCAVIKNTDKRSRDYGEALDMPRPSHSDYTSYVKYRGYGDHRGGGRFSGRLTAALVFAGALAGTYLERNDITVGAHLASVGPVKDAMFDPCSVDAAQLNALKKLKFPVILAEREDEMRAVVNEARSNCDSVGASIECAAVGMKAGIGEPFFDSVESTIASMLFSVPAVKGVEFGAGFAMSQLRGSAANDPFTMRDGRVVTTSNRNGGINGGITNGMPIIVRAAIKPTSSIASEQDTVSLSRGENAKLAIKGRHDPCIGLRAVPVIEAAVKLALTERYMEVQP